MGHDEECVRCGCVPGVATACDCRDDCACHWRESDRAAMHADEMLADRKEEGI